MGPARVRARSHVHARHPPATDQHSGLANARRAFNEQDRPAAAPRGCRSGRYCLQRRSPMRRAPPSATVTTFKPTETPVLLSPRHGRHARGRPSLDHALNGRDLDGCQRCLDPILVGPEVLAPVDRHGDRRVASALVRFPWPARGDRSTSFSANPATPTSASCPCTCKASAPRLVRIGQRDNSIGVASSTAAWRQTR